MSKLTDQIAYTQIIGYLGIWVFTSWIYHKSKYYVGTMVPKIDAYMMTVHYQVPLPVLPSLHDDAFIWLG